MPAFTFDDEQVKDAAAAPDAKAAFTFDDAGQAKRSEMTPLEHGGKGFARGALESVGMLAGGATGVAGGLGTALAVGAAFPPAAPITMPLTFGLVAGGLTYLGQWAGSQAADVVVGKETDADRAHPLYHGGRVLGEVAGGIGAFPSIARRVQGHIPGTRVGRFLEGMVNEAARGILVSHVSKKGLKVALPSRFIINETAAGAGAATASVISAVHDPDSDAKRAIAEIAGGVVGGSLLTARLYTALGGRLIKWLRKQSPSGRRSEASELLHAYVAEAGEDPEKLMKLIAQGKGAALTIAGMEGSTLPLHVSPVLQQLSADLGKHSSEYLARLGMQNTATLNGLSRAMLLLRADGSPEAMKLAMDMKHDTMEFILTRYVDNAKKRATKASSEIAGDDLLDEAGNIRLGKLEAMSAKADEVVTEHLDRMRSTEVELWTKAYEGTSGPISRKNMVVAYRDIVANRVADPGLDVPRTVLDRMENIIEARRIIGQAQKGGETNPKQLAAAIDMLSAKRLIRTKSQLLADMTKAAKAGDNNQAEMIGRLVQAVDDDLFAGGKTTRLSEVAAHGFGVETKGVRRAGDTGQFAPPTPLDDAISFTKAFRDVAQRSFIGEIKETTQMGARRIPAELMLRRSLASGAELGNLRMKEVREFLDFTPEQIGLAANDGAIAPVEAITKVVQAQSNMLRAAASVAVRSDGSISKVSLENFLRKNDSLLNEFPEVRQSIDNALSSDKELERFVARSKNYRKALDKRFATKSGQFSATGAVLAALNNRNVHSLDALTTLAQRDGPEAVASMQHTLWNIVFERARDNKGGYNISNVMQSWATPIAPGRESLRDYMISRDLMSKELAGKMDQIFEYTRRVLSADDLRGVSDPLPKPGMMETLVTSVFGAEAAKRAFQMFQRAIAGDAGKVSSGPTLVLAARGAEAMRGMLVKLPNAKMRALLQDALAGEPITPGKAPYSLLEILLQGPTSPSDAIQNFRRVNIYMWNAGYDGTNAAANEYIDEDFKQAGVTAIKKGADAVVEGAKALGAKRQEISDNFGKTIGVSNPTAKSQIPDSGPAKSGTRYEDSVANAQAIIDRFKRKEGVDVPSQGGTIEE